MTSRPTRSALGRVSAAWGVLGVALMLAQAASRLTPIALEAVRGLRGVGAWSVLVAWVVFNGYTEGFRGFHRAFSPRVVARALHLSEHPTWFRALLAPAFCMSLFGASRRGKRVAWSIVVFVTAVVVGMRWVSQPWRGIVDAGVVVGLGLGLLSLVYYGLRALFGHAPRIDADVPAPRDRC